MNVLWLTLHQTSHHARRWVNQFHTDQRGAEGLEKLLIIAAIVLPLLGVLIFFRNELASWVKSLWTNVKSDANQPL